MKTVVLTTVYDYHYDEPVTKTIIVNAKDSIPDVDVPNLLRKALQDYTGIKTFGENSNNNGEEVYFGRDIEKVPAKILAKYGLSFPQNQPISVNWDTGKEILPFDNEDQPIMESVITYEISITKQFPVSYEDLDNDNWEKVVDTFENEIDTLLKPKLQEIKHLSPYPITIESQTTTDQICP